MSNYPAQGDIITLNFDPSAGREIQKGDRHLLLVRKIIVQ